MSEEARCAPKPGQRCALCADEGLEGRVLSIDATGLMAEVHVDGVTHSVALELIADVAVGSLVLVHQGFAIHRLEETRP